MASSIAHARSRGHQGHGPLHLLSKSVGGKTVTKSVSGTALEKVQREVGFSSGSRQTPLMAIALYAAAAPLGISTTVVLPFLPRAGFSSLLSLLDGGILTWAP